MVHNSNTVTGTIITVIRRVAEVTRISRPQPSRRLSVTTTVKHTNSNRLVSVVTAAVLLAVVVEVVSVTIITTTI